MKIGEVYRDKDKRMQGRYVLVIATNGGPLQNKALCVPCSVDGRRLYDFATRISESTLRDRFELVKGVTILEAKAGKRPA